MQKQPDQKLGLSIRGGRKGSKGNPLDPNDEGIFVSKVRTQRTDSYYSKTCIFTSLQYIIRDSLERLLLYMCTINLRENLQEEANLSTKTKGHVPIMDIIFVF